MQVPLLDLKQQYQSIKDDVMRDIAEVFESQYFIGGPKVAECEKLLAEYCNTSNALGVSSGTDALLISLMAEKIGEGDEVITSAYTFFATAGSICRTGATPVFVDIDPETFNINPALIEEKITPRTKAIIPVHLYGQMADMDPIMDVAKRHNLAVIEDACQAIGAEYNGARAGSVGDYGCFSFFPSKNLGGAGDGGVVTTNDADKATLLSQLRNHGMDPKYYHKKIGGNFRLDAIQAAVISIKLKLLDNWTEGRQFNADHYGHLFDDYKDVLNGKLVKPAAKQSRHVYNQYIVRVKDRDSLRQYLADRDIGTEIYYPVPLHLQECFSDLGYKKGDLPEAEKAAEETLALPIFTELTEQQIVYVAESIVSFYADA